jgi:phosphoribosylglycinamide formyltransferase-1
MNIVVFVSGSGTNLRAICEKQKELENQGEKQLGAVKVVFTNTPNCGGAEIAKQYKIPVVSLSSKKFSEVLNLSADNQELRKYFDAATITAVESICKPDLIVLAGYRRKLSSLFYENYKNKIINLYPGDITKDYLVTGVQAPIQALRKGENSIKATVYLEQNDMRFGVPIILSSCVSLKGYTEDDIELINKKIREQAEWIIFPFVVHSLIARARIGIDNKSRLYLDSKLIGESGLQYEEFKEQNIS